MVRVVVKRFGAGLHDLLSECIFLKQTIRETENKIRSYVEMFCSAKNYSSLCHLAENLSREYYPDINFNRERIAS